MSVVEEYRQQYGFRDWATAYSRLPLSAGQTVLDLGCGLGDQARDLSARGAQVIGIDASPELLVEARRQGGSDIVYHQAELTALAGLGLPLADGLWCSFAAAYFPPLAARLAVWSRLLKPGAWLALVEADDIFGHTPMSPADAAYITEYYRQALDGARYDFQMGHKLVASVEAAGLELVESRRLADQEFSFQGPASEAVLAAWTRRLSRMSGLQALCGAEFPAFRERFLAMLADPRHESRAAVYMVLARRPGQASR